MDWIDVRLEGVPDALASQLRGSSEDLISAGVEALRLAEGEEDAVLAPTHGAASAERATGQGRAEPLLVADALITYACERALDFEDPEVAWNALLAKMEQLTR